MYKLKDLTETELLASTREVVAKERRVGLEVLEHIQEIESRGTHLKRGFGSLHEFLVKELAYSDGAAYRRIQAARLLWSLPESEARGVSEKIESGHLSMSTLTLAQNYFRAESKEREVSAEEKLELIQKIEGASTDRVKETLAELRPEMVKVESARPIGAGNVKVTVTLSVELMEQLNDLKNQLAHQLVDQRLETLLEKLVEIAQRKVNPIPKRSFPGKLSKSESEKEREKTDSREPHKPKNARVIPVALRREIFERSKINGHAACEFTDPITQRRCEFRHALQVDHVIPIAAGGMSDIDNLTVKCRAHNLWKGDRLGLG